METQDLVIIGGGPAGLATASHAQTNGMKQAIIDRCAVRHVRPIGTTYSHATARFQMYDYLKKYGNPMPVPTVYSRIV